MNINKILKLAELFNKIASIISPQQLKYFFEQSEVVPDIFFLISDLEIFLRNQVPTFRPNSWAEAQQKINLIKDWEVNVLQPYLDVINTINLSDDNIKKILGPDEFSYVNNIFFTLKKDIPEIKKAVQGMIDYCENLLNVHHYGDELYIRFGKYPKSERSRMGLGDEWVRELGGKRTEEGVSVYRTRVRGDKLLLIDSNSNKAIYQYHGFNPLVFADAINSGDIYLVTGKKLKNTGSDGEPLLVDVFPIRKLSPDEILIVEAPPTTLTDIIKKYDVEEFKGFKQENIRDRELMLGIPLLVRLIENGEINEPEESWISNKIWESGPVNELSEEDKEKLLSMIRQERKKTNKKLVFKGYRPFY